MFDCKRSKMSEGIYDNVIRTETLNRGERIEMMVDIYENPDCARNHEVMINTERHQALQHTGSVSVKNRRHRAVQVCLWLLCVLLLTAVIVLCVYFTTDRKHLLTHNYNLIKEREKILTEYTETLNQKRNLTEEREEIQNNADELTKKCDALQEERHQLIIETEELNRWFIEQDQHSDNFKWIYYNFSFYYISSNSESWSNSRRDCQQRGADLVIINSKEEQEFLQKSASNLNFYWIGLSKGKEVWKWIDETVLIYSFWLFKYHNVNLDCALTSASGWYYVSCANTYRWICEKRTLKSLM